VKGKVKCCKAKKVKVNGSRTFHGCATEKYQAGPKHINLN